VPAEVLVQLSTPQTSFTQVQGGVVGLPVVLLVVVVPEVPLLEVAVPDEMEPLLEPVVVEPLLLPLPELSDVEPINGALPELPQAESPSHIDAIAMANRTEIFYRIRARCPKPGTLGEMRRTFMAMALATVGWAACPSASPSDAGVPDSGTPDTGIPDSGARPFRIALSVDPFTAYVFSAGFTFTDGVSTATDVASLQAMYVAHGGSEVYARISTEKVLTGSPDDHSEQTALARAALAKSLGVPFNPELGLWAHYGDVGCEPAPDFSAYPSIQLPGPWNTLDIDQMAAALHDYAALVATDIVQTGATVEPWDIGNEIDFGVAGVAPRGINCTDSDYVAPDGVDPAIGQQTEMALFEESEADRIAWLSEHIWPREAQLLAAVEAGVRSAAPDASFATHISQSQSPTFAVAFYSAMLDGGFALDQLGFSSYLSSSNAPSRVANLQATVGAVHSAFGLPVFVAEFAYPAGTLGDAGPYATWTNALPSYPVSDDGQNRIFEDLASWGATAGVSGVRPWAPDVVVVGWTGMALFELDAGMVAIARNLDSLREGLSHPDAGAFHD
jgi:arabinogalactan endo-1,4-beta-galactosidase